MNKKEFRMNQKVIFETLNCLILKSLNMFRLCIFLPLIVIFGFSVSDQKKEIDLVNIILTQSTQRFFRKVHKEFEINILKKYKAHKAL